MTEPEEVSQSESAPSETVPTEPVFSGPGLLRQPDFRLEIDGQPVEFTHFYDGWPGTGPVYGCDELSERAETRLFYRTQCVWAVGVYRVNPDGSIWGMRGLFLRGDWIFTTDNHMVYRVWNRLI